jgi:hypothetical protein
VDQTAVSRMSTKIGLIHRVKRLFAPPLGGNPPLGSPKSETAPSIIPPYEIDSVIIFGSALLLESHTGLGRVGFDRDDNVRSADARSDGIVLVFLRYSVGR